MWFFLRVATRDGYSVVTYYTYTRVMMFTSCIARVQIINCEMDNYVGVWYAALLRMAQGWQRQLPVPWWSTAVSQMETTNKMQPRYTKELNVRGLKKMFLEIYGPCINKTCWWSPLHMPHREKYLFLGCLILSFHFSVESKLDIEEGQMVFRYIITRTAFNG